MKGRSARRRLPADRFQRRWWRVADPAGVERPRRVVYYIAEKATRIRGAGVVRTLVLADGDAQIPMLTNCAELPAAKAVHLLRMRWRQKNSFKYRRNTTASSNSSSMTRPRSPMTGRSTIRGARSCGPS